MKLVVLDDRLAFTPLFHAALERRGLLSELKGEAGFMGEFIKGFKSAWVCIVPPMPKRLPRLRHFGGAAAIIIYLSIMAAAGVGCSRVIWWMFF